MSQPVDCPFCDGDKIGGNQTCFVRLDLYPVAPGHMEILPRRHVASYRDLTPQEALDLHSLACWAMTRVPDADGWTIGINEGAAAGRTVDHLHMHLIPRRLGDAPDPRGGVRNVLPQTFSPDEWTQA